MRGLLDGKFSNFIKAQQALKFDKNDIVKLEISIDALPGTTIDTSELQKRLKDIKSFKIDDLSLEWLKSTDVFDDSYLKWLSKFIVPKFKLSSKDDHLSITVEGPYSDLILLEVGLQSLLCEFYFAALARGMNQDVGYFYTFATDRFQIKTSGFLNSQSIAIVEDATAFRPDSDFYSLQAILLPVSSFTYVGTTNPLIAQTFGQPIVSFCNEERWFEGWPEQNFAPSQATFDSEKHKGFYLGDAEFAQLHAVREAHPEAILIANELPVFEMAHAHSHFGNIVWLWSQDLVQDMNIDKYSAKVSWSE